MKNTIFLVAFLPLNCENHQNMEVFKKETDLEQIHFWNQQIWSKTPPWNNISPPFAKKFARIFRVHRKTWKIASHCESSQEFGTEQCQSSKMLEEKTETHSFCSFRDFLKIKRKTYFWFFDFLRLQKERKNKIIFLWFSGFWGSDQTKRKETTIFLGFLVF